MEENKELNQERKAEEVKEKPKFETVKTQENKKKNHRVLKVILIIIALLLVLFLIHFARNYIIVDNILAKQQKLKELNNYSLKANYVSENVTMEYYYKDSNMMMIRNRTDNEKTIIWGNNNTKEMIFLNPKSLTATVDKVSEDSNLLDKFLPRGIVMNSENTRGLEFLYFITSEKIDGRDCYKVKWLAHEETAWYDKESGRMIQNTEGEAKDSIIKYTDWKTNELTDEDMARPNLMGYEVTKNNEDKTTDEDKQDDNNKKSE